MDRGRAGQAEVASRPAARPALRLVGWNCCSGPREPKLAALAALEADVAVIPECPRLSRQPGRAAWIGANPRRGLGVIAAAPWALNRITTPRRLPRLVLPLLVTGPTTFLLLAIWALNDPVHPYVRGIHRALRACRPLLERYPTVLLGDFNSNAIWDHEHPEGRSHSALVAELGGLGLVSAYHGHFGESQGVERQPTFYLYRHADRPYHIDFCFLPAAWLNRVRRVTVGRHAEWAGRSDHMPLVVELEAER